MMIDQAANSINNPRRKIFLNGFTIAGLVVLALGTGPLFVGEILHNLGIVDTGGSGLGLGLLYFITSPIAALLLLVGFVVAVVRSGKSNRWAQSNSINPMLAPSDADWSREHPKSIGSGSAKESR